MQGRAGGQASTGQRRGGRPGSRLGHWLGEEELDAGEKRQTERWTGKWSESRTRETRRETTSASSLWHPPWICGRLLWHRQLWRDEGTLWPGPSDHGPQFLLEAAHQDCPPSSGMPGPCQPGLPAVGWSGLPCWPLGAEESQEPSGRDPRSSPGRGQGEKVQSLGQGDWDTPGPGGSCPLQAHPQGVGPLGALLGVRPQLSQSLSSQVPHPGVELTTSTATFSSTARPFRGAVTATPSSSAFLRSSSISWGQTSEEGLCQGSWAPAGSPRPRISTKRGPSPGLSPELSTRKLVTSAPSCSAVPLLRTLLRHPSPRKSQKLPHSPWGMTGSGLSTLTSSPTLSPLLTLLLEHTTFRLAPGPLYLWFPLPNTRPAELLQSLTPFGLYSNVLLREAFPDQVPCHSLIPSPSHHLALCVFCSLSNPHPKTESALGQGYLFCSLIYIP